MKDLVEPSCLKHVLYVNSFKTPFKVRDLTSFNNVHGNDGAKDTLMTLISNDILPPYLS